MIDLGDVSCVHVHHQHERVHHPQALAATPRRHPRLVHRMVVVVIMHEKTRGGDDGLWFWIGVRPVERNGVFDEVPGEQGDENVQDVAECHAS